MMDRAFARFFRVIAGVVLGALGSAAVGAVVGLAFWVTGLGFAYSPWDWPIGGAIFGLVVGAIGAAVAEVVQLAARCAAMRRGTRAAASIILSAVTGLVVGWDLFSQNGIHAAVIFGFCGGIGSTLGGLIAARIPTLDRPHPDGPCTHGPQR